MRINEMHEPVPHGTWTCRDISFNPSWTPEKLLEIYQPSIQLRLREQFNEATYRELAQRIDPNFLKQKIRAAELTGVRPYLNRPEWANGRETPFDPEDTMNFLVNSSEIDDNGVSYINQIKFVDWDEMGSDPDTKSAREKALKLLWESDIKYFCSDPSFLYWGYKYILTTLDASIYPEIRPPEIRNPQHRGIICKHGNRVLRVLPFFNADIAKEMKAQFGS